LKHNIHNVSYMTVG